MAMNLNFLEAWESSLFYNFDLRIFRVEYNLNIITDSSFLSCEKLLLTMKILFFAFMLFSFSSYADAATLDKRAKETAIQQLEIGMRNDLEQKALNETIRVKREKTGFFGEE